MTARRNDRAQAERRALGRRIRAHRLALGLTQADISAHTHTGKAQMYAVEHGSKDVLTGTLIDIADAVGLDVALVGEHHLPLLDLTAGEIKAVLLAAALWADNADDPDLVSALTKLTAHDADARPLVAPYRPTGALDATTVHLPVTEQISAYQAVRGGKQMTA